MWRKKTNEMKDEICGKLKKINLFLCMQNLKAFKNPEPHFHHQTYTDYE